MSLYNLAKMSTATTGTGTITLGSAVSGFLTFAQAGAQSGDTVTYAIEDGANREIGRGVYTTAGTTLTRSVLKSTNSNNPINLSGTATVFITAAAEDFSSIPTNLLASDNTWTGQNTFAQGSLTASKPFTWTQTWNNAAVDFTAALMNVTNTASGGGSLLLDLQVGGASRAQISRDGYIRPLSGIQSLGSTILFYNSSGGLNFISSQNQIALGGDATIARDAADIVALKNGTTAQTLRVYGTTTGSKYVSVRHNGTNGFVDVSSGCLVVGNAYTVAALPTGVAGARAWVTDASAPTFLGALTGGGAVVTPVFHNGTAWVAG